MPSLGINKIDGRAVRQPSLDRFGNDENLSCYIVWRCREPFVASLACRGSEAAPLACRRKIPSTADRPKDTFRPSMLPPLIICNEVHRLSLRSCKSLG